VTCEPDFGAILQPVCAVTPSASCLVYLAGTCGSIRGSFSIVVRSRTRGMKFGAIRRATRTETRTAIRGVSPKVAPGARLPEATGCSDLDRVDDEPSKARGP